MLDETIATTLYRTGRGDRSIPLSLGVLLLLSAPALAWAAHPFLVPWGLLASLLTLFGAWGALVRWNRARGAVLWDNDTLEFRQGKRRTRVDLASLTRVRVVPSAVTTELWVGRLCYRLSHRLVRADDLLDRLRRRRPDLFPVPEGRLVFRRSSTSALFQAALAGGTLLAGLLLAGWQPWLGWVFGVAAGYVLLRIGFFIPRAHVVTPQSLVNVYWLRRKRWGRPESVREAAYAAGGAVFFRMVISYDRWKVVLDEGQLLDPVRPWAGAIVHLLSPPG